MSFTYIKMEPVGVRQKFIYQLISYFGSVFRSASKTQQLHRHIVCLA
nr:MAG TPA: hypothetical protein [Caudoviricetes sp.]